MSPYRELVRIVVVARSRAGLCVGYNRWETFEYLSEYTVTVTDS